MGCVFSEFNPKITGMGGGRGEGWGVGVESKEMQTAAACLKVLSSEMDPAEIRLIR
jgi:hypothetical protein